MFQNSRNDGYGMTASKAQASTIGKSPVANGSHSDSRSVDGIVDETLSTALKLYHSMCGVALTALEKAAVVSA
jgi:hypothetical protein